MGLFGLLGGANINDGVREFNETPNAVLIDVRGPQEFRRGHIPRAENVPLPQIGEVGAVAKDKDSPVFCYCLSGGRSAQAARALQRMGYTDVRNIGGINGYKGEME